MSTSCSLDCARRSGASRGRPSRRRVGDLQVDIAGREVTFADRPVQLTPHEFTLLSLLIRNEGKLLTHKAILEEVWGHAYAAESHYLHVYVSQLRRKLEPDPARPRYILTEPGVGSA